MRSGVFDGAHPLALRLQFDSAGVMLAPVIVRDSVRNDPSGFEKRRERGQGVYITEAQISARSAQLVEHLLATVPGLQVDTAGIVHADRGRTSILADNCQDGVQLFVDGIAVGSEFTLRNLSAASVRNIEVYRGVASTPVELRSRRVACGTVAIWTK